MWSICSRMAECPVHPVLEPVKLLRDPQQIRHFVHFEQQMAACCWVWRSSDFSGKAVKRREDQEKWKRINKNHPRLLWWPVLCLKEDSRRFSHLKMSRDSLTFGNVSATQICTTDTRRVVLVKTSDTKAFMWSFRFFRRNNESLSQTSFYDHPFKRH